MQKGPRGRQSGRLYFDCPFHKLDPVRFPHCGTYGFDQFHRVTNHLWREHLVESGVYCDRCRLAWQTDEGLNHHQRHHCGQGLVSLWDTPVLTSSEREAFTATGGTEEARWYSMWNFLFPNQLPPSSCYVIDGEAIRTHLGTQLHALLASWMSKLNAQHSAHLTTDLMEFIMNHPTYMEPHNDYYRLSFRLWQQSPHLLRVSVFHHHDG